MDVEPYDHERDLAAAQRIWEECRWVEDDDDRAALAHFLEVADGFVARLDGAAECLVTTMPGLVRHGRTDLTLCAVTSVTTSLVGRKQRLAGTVTATALRTAAGAGASVAMLGMFEQGFYDRLGFGTGSYEHTLTLDPASLTVPVPDRRPVRLTTEDWEEIHRCMTSRQRRHGGVAITPAGFTRAETAWTETPFGLGFRDDDGTLTHLVWGKGKGENGPFTVTAMAFHDDAQLLELLGLLRSLDDQVRSVKLTEPAGIQLQDLIAHVGRQEIRGMGSVHGYRNDAGAWWQVRILDLPVAVAACRTPGPTVRFVLELTDTLAADGWPGTNGSWILTLGPNASSAQRGEEDGLPQLTATVNAFSRLWLGVRPATSLAVTDHLAGPPDLLAALDAAFAGLPTPHTGLDF